MHFTNIFRNEPTFTIYFITVFLQLRVVHVGSRRKWGVCVKSWFHLIEHALIQKVFVNLFCFVEEGREDPNTTKSWPMVAQY